MTIGQLFPTSLKQRWDHYLQYRNIKNRNLALGSCKLSQANCQLILKHCTTTLQSSNQKNIRFDCKTNLGRKFLHIVDKCFPKNYLLHKIFNRHTLKLSYSCLQNMKSIISSHNKHVLSKTNTPTQQPDTCNCRKKPDCPLEGKCLQTNVIYQATVTTETYVGLATNFKERYRNHQTSFRHSKRRNETELSKYVWNLQDAKKLFGIKWKVIKKCDPYGNVSKKCNLCLYEKFIIICKKELCSLNRRNEFWKIFNFEQFFENLNNGSKELF